MGRRKQLKNITQGLLSSFISRNNDVSGYWGIGKLYSLMLDNDCGVIEIDLLGISIIPVNKKFIRLIEEYHLRLVRQLLKNELEISNVSKAKIKLVLTGNNNNVSKGSLDFLQCTFEITDDLNRKYRIENGVFCRKHNPNLELKSSRNYD